MAERRLVVQRLVLVWFALGIILLVLVDATVEKLFILAVLPWAGWIGFGVVVLAFLLHNAYSLGRARRWGWAMVALAELPAAAGILVLSAPRLSRFGESTICCAHPTDDALIRRFLTHSEEFERLVKMSDADPRVIRIAPSFTRLDNNWAWPRPDSLLGFAPARWREYRHLFAALHLEGGLERGEGDYPAIYLLASGRGMVTGGCSKGYAYSPTELSPTYQTLDSVPSDLPSNVPGYRHVSGPWYLYYSWDD